MGALLSICGLGQMACCAASTACSCFSAISPAIGARVMYTIMLLMVTITGWIMTLPSVSEWLQSKLPFCWNTPSFTDILQKTSNYFGATSSEAPKTNICEQLTGYLAVYRLMFATFVFFLVFGVIMLKITRDRDPRVAFHRGFWILKFLLLIGLIVGAFYIPENNSFSDVWRNIGLVGSFLYLLIQICCLLLFADEWADDWINKSENGQKGYLFGLATITLMNFLLSFIGIVLFYIYYGGDGCVLHKWLISINLIMFLALSVISVLPSVQEYSPRSGIFQASVVCLYLTYMTWSALNSSPDQHCKPTLWSGPSTNIDSQSFVSLLICFICVIYSSFRLSSRQGMQRISGISHDDENNVGSNTRLTDANSTNEESDDHSNLPYFYWFLALGTLYLMMTLTNWFTPQESYHHFGESSSSLWIKMISTWFSGIIYFWTLMAPILLSDCRDFS